MSDAALPAIGRWPRPPVGGLVAFGVAVLLAAGAIHIGAILLVPVVARSDGWSRLSAAAGVEQFVELPNGDGPAGSGASSGVVGLDPLFVNGACRLDLAQAPAGISVEARDRFWSLALSDPRGTIVFSLNDRTAVNGRLDMSVVNAAQNVALQRSRPAEFEQMIVVESGSDDLVAIVRLFAPTDVARSEARRILAAAECLPEPLEPAAAPSGR